QASFANAGHDPLRRTDRGRSVCQRRGRPPGCRVREQREGTPGYVALFRTGDEPTSAKRWGLQTMKKKLSIGSWAYIFNQETPTNDFHVIVHKLSDLGYDGVELGGFNPHPGPDTCDTRAKRQALRQSVKEHGLEFSGLAADLWSQKLLTVEDSGPYIAAFAKNLFFAEDLGIDTIRVDTVEPINVVKEKRIEPKVIFDRAVRAFDLCAKLAANRGIRICWEFEPGFPINKPSEIVALVDAVRGLGNPNFGVLFDTCHAHLCAAV